MACGVSKPRARENGKPRRSCRRYEKPRRAGRAMALPGSLDGREMSHEALGENHRRKPPEGEREAAGRDGFGDRREASGAGDVGLRGF